MALQETIRQLEAQHARTAKELAGLEAAIKALKALSGAAAPVPSPAPAATPKAAKKRTMPASAIEKIRAAQKARWAKIAEEKAAKAAHAGTGQ